MKTRKSILFFAFIMALLLSSAYGQDKKIAYFKPNSQEGVNMFEAPKNDTLTFSGLKVRIGGNFTQQFQAITHTNEASPNNFTVGENVTDLNKLYPLSYGFNLAAANLNFDIQLEDGIRISLENYMSSRHHPEFWVKGGYIQVDKLPMFGNPEWFTKYVSARVGHFGINYGDQQFRRSDNGKTIYNPFVGNYIMDAFATEIGAEVYVFPVDNVFLMLGLTNGLIGGDVKDYGETKKSPSLLAKAGYDNQFNEDFRLRLSASYYSNSGTTRNTLYAGDRAGSRYYMVMEPEFYRNFQAGGALTASTAANRFTSARIAPDFPAQVSSLMINPFLKFKGLEFFGTYETTSGKTATETETRKFTQMTGEIIYRFLPREQVYIGGRYNVVSGRLPNYDEDISIDRLQVGMGWFTTKNLLVKLEYVTQNYNNFKETDFRHNGKFSGVMMEAIVAF